MRLVSASIAAISLASVAHAQARPDLPSGNPLGAGVPVVVPDQALADQQRLREQAAARARARARANAQAMADAFAPIAPAAVPEEEMKSRVAPSYSQTIGSVERPAQAAPSPYGSYYQIRTPWDPR